MGQTRFFAIVAPSELATVRNISHEGMLHLAGNIYIVEHRIGFVIHAKTADIHIGGTYAAHLAIDHERFWVEIALLVEIDARARP